MSFPWAVPIAAVLMTAGFLLVVDYSDDSAATDDPHLDRTGDDVTITGHGTLEWDDSWNGLKNLTIVPEGGEVEIGDGAFFDKDSLLSVTVQGSVGSIGSDAFNGCGALSTFTVQGPVGSLGENAFFGCNALSTFTVQGSIGSMKGYVFYDCDALETVTVQGSVDSIGDYAFFSCGVLSTFTIPGPVGSIGDYTFFDCDDLAAVTIDGSVDSIGESAFENCNALDTVTITGPIASIESHAFLGCYELKTLNIACNDPLAIHMGQTENGHIAYNATAVNNVHRYSATYNWADDGKTCTVHMECANSPYHNHYENADVTSTVKIPPTATEMGTTTYSVSGTYDGFAYSDTKDVQDIPCKSGSDGDDADVLVYIAAAGAIGAVILIGAAFVVMKTRRRH